MAGVGATLFADGYPANMSYGDEHDLQVTASAAVTTNADATATLRVAWLIVIGSLVALWFMGYTFKG